MVFCEFIKEIDFFGKIPEFYIKGKPKQVTYIGRIFTFIYILIYITIFVYKLYRMVTKEDITFIDLYLDIDILPSYQINKENFYFIFSLSNNELKPFIDESIYYPEAYFANNGMNKIAMERCNIDKIDSKYKNLFDDLSLNDHYCLSDINYTLISHYNSFIFKIFPCKNTTENNNHCKSKEIIEQNIDLFFIYFKDLLITPNNYSMPVKPKNIQFNTYIYKTLGQYIYAEMQLINIETSINIIGFDFLTKPKEEQFIKYDSLRIFPQPGYDLDDENNNNPMVEVELTLNDKILLEKRQYIQFIDVLGEVGGLMEFLSSFFEFVCNLIGDILYERTIANNLFSFDIKKKLI